MENIINSIGINNIIVIMVSLNIILLIAFITLLAKTSKLSKKYTQFMQKLGNGETIEEDLENYMYRVERVEKQNGEIAVKMQEMEKDLKKCIKKIGIVRYNAFNDVGSDLSFTLALLDDSNDGIVLNGIYARDSSNIYAKPIEKGNSNYVLSSEEKEAINKAMGTNSMRKKE